MKRRTRIVVTVLFLTAIALPALIAATGVVHVPLADNRSLTAAPSLAPGHLLDESTYTQLTGFLTDRLPGRSDAIEARERLSAALFKQSAGDRVVDGTDGWRYLGQDVHADCLSTGDESALEASVAALTQLLAAAGKQLHILIAPDKETVYPQHLVDGDRALRCHTANSLKIQEAVRSAVPGFSSVLATARTDPDLYYPADTHWNGRGALLGTTDLINALQPGLFDGHAYTTVPNGEAHPDDLRVLQGTPGSELADRVDVSRPGITLSSTEVVSPPLAPGVSPLFAVDRERRAGEGLIPGRVLVLHDSFGVAVKPLASPWFSDVTWHNLAAPNIAAEVGTADSVVIVLVERDVPSQIPLILAAARTALAH